MPNAAQRCAIWQTSYRTWKCYIFLGWVPPSWVPCSSQSPHNLVAGSEPYPRWNGVSSPAMVIACSRCWRGPEITSSLFFFGLYKQMSGFESAGCLVSVTSPPCLFLAIFTAPKSHDLHSGIKCFFWPTFATSGCSSRNQHKFNDKLCKKPQTVLQRFVPCWAAEPGKFSVMVLSSRMAHRMTAEVRLYHSTCVCVELKHVWYKGIADMHLEHFTVALPFSQLEVGSRAQVCDKPARPGLGCSSESDVIIAN